MRLIEQAIAGGAYEADEKRVSSARKTSRKRNKRINRERDDKTAKPNKRANKKGESFRLALTAEPLAIT